MPILLPGPLTAATDTRWDAVWHKTKSCQPQTGRSRPGCELQRAQLQACIPPPLEGSSPDRKEEQPQHLTQTPLERSPSPAKLLKMQHNLSELPSKPAGACIWGADRKETRKHSGVLATDYWTNREWRWENSTQNICFRDKSGIYKRCVKTSLSGGLCVTSCKFVFAN